jgi:hypothetical protein
VQTAALHGRCVRKAQRDARWQLVTFVSFTVKHLQIARCGYRRKKLRFRRPENSLAKAGFRKDLENVGEAATALWECAADNSCDELTIIGTINDDRLVALVKAWPRLSEKLQTSIVGLIESPEVALGVERQQP